MAEETDPLLPPEENTPSQKQPEKPLITEWQVKPPDAPIDPVIEPDDILRTPQQILKDIQRELNNKPPTNMAEEKDPLVDPTPETKPKKEKKIIETVTAVVKKDYTLLILALGVLIITIGIYAWQNYRKRKDEENTIDAQATDLSREEQERAYNEQNQYR